MAQITGYELLSDWDRLPRAKGFSAGLASSYDRSGGNYDWNHYHSPTGLLDDPADDGVSVTVAELTGPGVLTRFWMPHAAADTSYPLKVYVDGQLRIDTDSDVYLGGQHAYAGSPLTATLVGGQFSYEPIAFQHSLRIESKNYTQRPGWAAKHHYYQWSYRSGPTGAAVQAYDGSLTPAQQSQRSAAVTMLDNVGQNPAGQSAVSTVQTTAGQAIAPGAGLTLHDRSGSGQIRSLKLRMPSGAADANLDGLRLCVRYDGQVDEAIDVPVSHFFGVGHQRAEYQSLPLGVTDDGEYYCYWPMPYRQGVTVELRNTSGAPVNIASAEVEYETRDVAVDEGYLRAVHSEQLHPAGTGHHEILDVTGRGHYVGNFLYLQREGTSGGILEGDERIFVDDALAQHGTGLEDAYNGGYYYNHVLEQADDGDVPDSTSGDGPFSGLLRMNFEDLGDDYVRTDQYRWYIADAVPFTDGIRIDIENYQQREALFGSTAFYYAVPELIAGDTDGDGAVTLADAHALRDHYGTISGARWEDGDFDLDGDVDFCDAWTWLGAYQGAPAPEASLAWLTGESVPEPASLVLLAVGGVALLRRRS
jgi:hypothetical protein